MKSNWIKVASILGCLFLFGCVQDIEVTDGRVPTEYQAGAKKLIGTYEGTLGGTPVEMTLAMNADVPAIQTSRDLVSQDCHSQVGLLKKVSLSDQDIATLYFDFNPGSCLNVNGRSLNLSAKTSSDGSVNSLYVRYLDRVDSHSKYLCEPRCNPYGVCKPWCHFVFTNDPIYTSGVLIKKP